MKVSLSSSVLLSIALFPGTAVFAQPIAPTNDGTGTIVTPEGDSFDIHGGTRSSDGRNLFHSFERFGLDTGQTANFLADPHLSNILGRVTGGEASFLDGLLQVSGGDANLFLLNPAGIVFGPNAALNVPGDFTATTATGIGFENGGRFSMWGNGSGNTSGGNPWADLVGMPNVLDFAVANPGAIVNAGHLSVLPGQNLSLLAGAIVNTGTLQAPGGNITVAAVPGESLVRLSAAGNLLSLEIESLEVEGLEGESTANSPNSRNFTPLSLPQLLAGGKEWGHATSIAVNPDGTLSLVGSQTAIAPQTGDAIVSGTLGNGEGFENTESPTIQILGNRVALLDATLDASGANGGGNIFLGGDFRGLGTIPNARYTFVDAETAIFADALQRGNGGRVILWADDTTQFFGNISARGSAEPNASGGFVEVSGKQSLVFRGDVDTRAPNGTVGTLLLDPENISIADGNGDGAGDGVDFFTGNARGQVLMGDPAPVTIYESELEALNGNTDIILEATNNITVEDLSDNTLTFRPGGGTVVFVADADGVDGGSFVMNPGDTLSAPGRDVTISGASLTLGKISTSNFDGDGGDITLRSSGGDISTNRLLTFSQGAGTGGNISIEITGGPGTIDTRDGTLRASSINGRGGNITLRAHDGDILTFNVRTNSEEGGTGGNILFEITGAGNIHTGNGDLGSDSKGEDGGNITLTTNSGNITTADIFALSEGGGDGGNITLTVREGTGNINVRGLQSFSELGSGGNISVTTASGNIVATNHFLSQSEDGGNAGDVTLRVGEAGGSVNVLGAIAPADRGNGGNLSIFVASGDIQLGGDWVADTRSDNRAGNITIEIAGKTGSLDTGEFDLFANASGENIGNGGTIEIRVPGNANVREISAKGGNNGGNLTVVSGENMELGGVFADGGIGNGGTLDLRAEGNITTTNISSSGGQDGGNISLTSRTGSINTSGEVINAIGGENGGNIFLDSALDIRIGGIGDTALLNPGFNRNSGQIDLRARGGTIELTGPLLTLSALGRGGNVTLDADGNIILNEIDARSLSEEGGTVEVRSRGSIQLGDSIETNQNNILINGPVTLSEDVTISSLDTGNIQFNNTIDGSQNLVLNAERGNIQILGAIGNNTALESIDLQSRVNHQNRAIAIRTTGDITAQNLTSRAGINLVSEAGQITANRLDTSSIEDSGNVFLNAPNIQLDRIDTQSENGVGGNVNINVTDFLRVTGSFRDRNGTNASISTAGGINGGAIVIRHGGNGEIPFIVGNPHQNGTAGAITRGNSNVATIAPGEFLYTHTQDADRIQVISVPAPPELPQPPEPPPTDNPGDGGGESDNPGNDGG
ncbi:MAG: filamentous hemagglutinin N-terminal domain-containing protein, partial [Cyanobacteriota bacterium]|nr:filamentous hemagglutinin N-terminal domain-containing protein [Cyanobacteriota bacterium]